MHNISSSESGEARVGSIIADSVDSTDIKASNITASSVTASGEVTASGIKLSTHTHSGDNEKPN